MKKISKKSILVVNSTLDLYGANRILTFVLQILQKKFNIVLLLPTTNGPLIEHLKQNGVSFELLVFQEIPIIQRKMFSIVGIGTSIKQLLIFFNFIKKLRNKQDFEFVFINTLSNVLCLPIFCFLKFKIFTHVHEILESPRLVAKTINWMCLKYSSNVIVVSDAVRKNLLDENKKYSNKVEVIHNGIKDLIDNKSVSIRQSCIITLISRIKPDKGIWFFLNALAKIKNKDKVKIRIIGGPPPFGEFLIEKLKSDIATLKMDIEYIGFTDNVNYYLNETDILVVPSLMKDPFPTTVLEGMSCAKPVVATNTGGSIEAIEDQKSGILINPNDESSFAEVIDELVENQAKRKEIGIEARRRFLDKFSIDSFENRLSQYFSQN